MYSEWGGKVLKALEGLKIGKAIISDEQKVGAFINKNIGDLLNSLFEVVDENEFKESVQGYVKKGMIGGLEKAEEELGLDIGVSPLFSDQVKSLTDQQFNGYTIDGKQWPGIKGINNRLRDDVLDTIRDGVVNLKSRKAIVDDVKTLFSKASDSQASRIANTESNRFFNQGKLSGMASSGLKGLKKWNALPGECPLCDALANDYKGGIPYGQPFVSKGKEVMAPPLHPNCRCAVGFVWKGGEGT